MDKMKRNVDGNPVYFFQINFYNTNTYQEFSLSINTIETKSSFFDFLEEEEEAFSLKVLKN